MAVPVAPGARPGLRGSRLRPVLLGLAACLIAVTLLAGAPRAEAYYIYYCPGYTYNNVPPSCTGDPYNRPATHQWLAQQAKLILFYDGYTKYGSLGIDVVRVRRI